jgi:hypothetical protein
MTTQCCDSHQIRKVAVCPVNGKTYREVGLPTVLHHTRKPWAHQLSAQHYYFCTDPHCDVVYFGDDDSLITRREIRGPIGQKSTSPHRIICYCFDINLSDIKLCPEHCRQFVAEQTRQGVCDCATRNPSGKCCLRDFPKTRH